MRKIKEKKGDGHFFKKSVRHLFPGFTLIEIIVVVIVVTVLAAIGFPNYQKAVLRQQEQDAATQLRSIHTISNIYFQRAKEYPNLSCTGTDCLTQINSELGMSLMPSNDMLYDYSAGGTPPTAYSAWVRVNPGKSSYFRVEIKNTAPAPCCANGSCPTLPPC